MVNDCVTQVHSFDGQTIWSDKNTALYEVGNFLGGGAAGTVYEAEHVKSRDNFAVKILNPLGYKLLSPTLLRRCTVVSKGKAVYERPDEKISEDNVWWLLNGSTKQYIAACFSDRSGLRELSLRQCIDIWGTSPKGLEKEKDLGPKAPPSVPTKFAEFVLRRDHIFREITNMRKISAHRHVIRLDAVLELAQESKCTIFLVMELANGGELFDRIKLDCGTREDTARQFFRQVLEGVSHCHAQGVCHRDLKPENLLLSDAQGTLGTILKIADFGFSARIAMDNFDAAVAGGGPGSFASPPATRGVRGTGGPMAVDSPLRMLKSVVGSPFYVAPEVVQAATGYDGVKADVWSLGVILYAMLAGNLPFLQDLSTCKRFKSFVKWVTEAQTQAPAGPAHWWQAPDLEFPTWLFPSKFSQSARGLIVMMLHPDPLKRFGVSDAQRHPFVAPPAPPLVAATVVGVGVATDPVTTLTLQARGSPTASPVAAREIIEPLSLVASRIPGEVDGVVVAVCAPDTASPMDKADGNEHAGAGAEVGVTAVPVSVAARAGDQSGLASRNSASAQSMDQQDSDAEGDSGRYCGFSCADEDLFMMDVDGDSGAPTPNLAGGRKKVSGASVFCPRSPSSDVTKKPCLEEDRTRSGKGGIIGSPGLSSTGGSASNSPSLGNTWTDCEGDHQAQGAAAEPRRLSSLFSAVSTGTASVPPTPPSAQITSTFGGVGAQQVGLERSQTVGMGAGIASGVRAGGIGAGFAGLPERAHTTGTTPFRSAPMQISGGGNPNPNTSHQQPTQHFAASYSVSKAGGATTTGFTGASELGGYDTGGSQPISLAASCPQPPVAPLIFRDVADLLGAGDADDMEVSGSSQPALSPTSHKLARAGSGHGSAAPPSFHELVKRSTRFVTTVPAMDVLLKVEQLLQTCCRGRSLTPIGLVGRVAVCWEQYRLDVWGFGDVVGHPVCSLQLFQYQAPETGIPVPSQPLSSAVSPPAPTPPQYLVEFIRQGSLEIFMFKRFYQWIRQQLVADLVKINDYGCAADQFAAGSPMTASSLTSRFMYPA